MTKVYSEKTVSILQTAIDKLKPEFERQEYGFLDRLNMAGIRIELWKEPSGQPNGQIVISTYRISSEYMKIWKTYSPGHFLITDFKKQIVDKEGLCPYYIVRTTLGNFPVRAILRELFEEDAQLRDKYGDINKDGHVYTIIKICPIDEDDDTWLSGNGKIDITHTAEIDTIDGFDSKSIDIKALMKEIDSMESVKITSPSKQLEYTEEDIDLITEVAGTYI